MADAQMHLKQWLHNRDLIPKIPSSHNDWVVIVSFYAALQSVDALLAHDKIPVNNHETRNSALANNNRYREVWRHYRQLYDCSITARYDADPESWIEASELQTEIFTRLYKIENSSFKLMGVNPSRSLISSSI